MYAAIIRKKPKVIGTELKSFINNVSYYITGVISVGFSAWIYYSPKRPTRENLEKIRNSELLTGILTDMSRPTEGEYMYLDPALIEKYKKERELSETVYEAYQTRHGKAAETHEKPKEKQQ